MRSRRATVLVAVGSLGTIGALGVGGLLLASPPAHSTFVAPPVSAQVQVHTASSNLTVTTVNAPQVLIPGTTTTWSFLVQPQSPAALSELTLAVNSSSSIADDVHVQVTSCQANAQAHCVSAPVADGNYMLNEMANPIAIAQTSDNILITLTLGLARNTPPADMGATVPMNATINGVIE